MTNLTSGTKGKVLLRALISLPLIAVILWWVELAFFRGPREDPKGYLTLFGAPIAVVALGGLIYCVISLFRLLRKDDPPGD